MKSTLAILTLSIGSALAQTPAVPARSPVPLRSQVTHIPAAQPSSEVPGAPKKAEPDLLDLKPSIVKYEEDGLFLPKICLKSPKARVLFSEPNGFRLDEGAAVFTLVCKADATATVNILTSASPILPLDTEERRKEVRASILATAPKDAEHVEMVSEGENPFPINGWTTYQFTMSYGLFGQTIKKQIVFVRLHQAQELQFVAYAPEKHFGSAAGALGSVLNTWYREPLSLIAGGTRPKVERD